MRRNAAKLWALGAVVAACVGPPAPDAAVCQDTIHRLCLPPRCSSMAALDAETDCEQTLLVRTGCDNEEFAFTAPSRERVLECRIGLLHAGKDRDSHPDCLDVDQLLLECPDVTRFLRGLTP